ncbi:MAG: DEAD/DEAH box helicase [Desulfobacteraceae bacterium 4572_87]|nr:MAG: DEAD/DEAH box helicase [Desulfobacteraceae bacterium 4572_87]
MDFETLGLVPHIIKAVQDLGFEAPTPIQEKAIPAILSGCRDLVGLAQTGTGKTAAYGLPMLQSIDFSKHTVQGLILCPTRELCVQISKDLVRYSRYVKNAKIVAVYGGAGMDPQIRQIKKGAQIIVATPGRLLDLIHRRIVNLNLIDYVVLDEADEMLTMGFQEDLDEILAQTPSEKRSWLFSATMTAQVARISRNYMKDPVEITIGRKNSGATNISHLKYVVLEKDRYPALKRIIDYHPNIFSLVFCRTRRETQAVAEKLIKDGYNAESLHGELSQTQRDYVMGRFREKSLQILVATDVAARGLDVDDISHVINYNLPDEAGAYTHRSGRTARAGKSGTSIVLMNTRENRKLAHVEQKTGVRFQYEKVPSGRAVCEKQLYGMVEKLVETHVNHEEIGAFLPPVYDTLAGLSKEELIQHFVSIEFNRFLDYYKNSGDINARTPRKKAFQKKRPTGKKAPFGKRSPKDFPENPDQIQKLFLNMGQLDDIQKGAITRLVCDKSGIRSSQIGKIEVMREFSFLEVDADSAAHVMKSMKGASLDGKRVSMGYAEKKSEKPSRSGKKRGAKKKWTAKNGKTSNRGRKFPSSKKRTSGRANERWES